MANTKITSANLDTNIAIAGTLGVTGNITGTLATASQPNITSVGTLTSFRSTGIDDNADATAITIDSSERVGIGLTPSDHAGYMLQITGGSQSFIAIGNDTTGTGALNGLILGNDSTGADIYQRENQPLRLHTNNTERMRIDASGNVGIGVTSSYPLTVQSGTAGSNHAIALRNNSTNNLARLGFLQQDSATAAYTSIDGDGRSTGYLKFNTNDTERMRITDAGKIGVGMDSPSQTIHVHSTSEDILGLQRTGTSTGAAYIKYINDGGNAYIGVDDSAGGRLFVSGGSAYALSLTTESARDICLGTNNTERMRIDSSGRLMVGTTSALAGNSKLSIVGEATAGQQQVTLHNPATSGTRYFMAFGTEASYTERGYIAYNGSSVFVGTVSDIKLKENIRDLDNGLSVISKIKPRVFDWKDGHEKNAVGFISQEIEEIKPDWVNEKDNIKFIESNLTSSIPYIIKAIQEQQEQIETLKAEVQELKDNG
jgi:hypothetical protein